MTTDRTRSLGGPAVRRAVPFAVLLLLLAACGGTTDTTDSGMPGTDPGPASDLGIDAPDVADPDPGQPTDPGRPPDDATTDPGDGDLPPAQDVKADFGPPRCEGELAPQALPLDADTTFLRGPYVQDVTTTSAVIVWRPAAPIDQEGCVHYTLDDAPLTACAMPDSRGQYEVRLAGLPPATAIPYSVAIGDTETTVPMAFSTAPDTARPVRLLVFADGHRNDAVLRSIAEDGLDLGADLAVSVGDLVSQPEEEQFDLALEGLRPLMHRVPMYAVLGNHEARGSSHFAAFVISGAAPDEPTERYYSVRYGDVWMGMLEVVDFQATQMFGVDTDQIVWLKQELDSEAARTARWRLLFIHHPPWCQGWGHCDGYNGEDSLREILVPLAAEKGVAAIFSGHMHGYERGELDGVALVISGGGGGALDMSCPAPEGLPSPWLSDYAFHRVIVDANCDTLAIEARALDGRLIDSHEIPYAASGN